MKRIIRIFTAALLMALTLLLALPVRAEEAAKWECMPESGANIYPEDKVVYKLTVLEAGATDAWTVLTIRLGDGMRMDTVSFVGAEQTAAQQEQQPGGAQANVSREVIPGNDGCVVLASALQAGDVLVFSAFAETADAAMTATAYTDTFSVSVEHTLIPRPTPVPATEPTPVPTLEPVPEPEEEPESEIGRIVGGVILIGGLLLVTALAFKKHPWVKRRAAHRKDGSTGAPGGGVQKVYIVRIESMRGSRPRLERKKDT